MISEKDALKQYEFGWRDAEAAYDEVLRIQTARAILWQRESEMWRKRHYSSTWALVSAAAAATLASVVAMAAWWWR